MALTSRAPRRPPGRVLVAAVAAAFFAAVAVALVIIRLNGILVFPWDTAQLDVQILSLPKGVDADVQIQGPSGYSAHVRSTTVLSGLQPGQYAVVAHPVHDVAAAFYPESRQSTLFLGRLKSGTVSADYYDFIPSSTHVLSPATLNGLTDHSPDYSTLSFAVGTNDLASVKPGDVLVAGISANTPLGFLLKVTAITTGPGGVQISATRALITDAVPRGHLVVRLGASELKAATSSNSTLALASFRTGSLLPSAANSTEPQPKEFVIPVTDLTKLDQAATKARFFKWELNSSDSDLSTKCSNAALKLDFHPTFRPIWLFDVKWDVRGPDPFHGDLRVHLDFRVHQEFGVEEQVGAKVTALAGTSCSLKWEPFDQFFAPFDVQLGPVPVVVQPEVAFEVELAAKLLTPLGSLAVTQDGRISETVDLAPGHRDVRIHSTFHGRLAAALSQAIDQGATSQTGVDGSIGPKIQVTFYGLVGPSGQLGAFLNASAPDDEKEHQEAGHPLSWSVYAGIKGKIDLNLGPHFALGPLKFDKSFALPIKEAKWVDLQVASGHPRTTAASNSPPTVRIATLKGNSTSGTKYIYNIQYAQLDGTASKSAGRAINTALQTAAETAAKTFVSNANSIGQRRDPVLPPSSYDCTTAATLVDIRLASFRSDCSQFFSGGAHGTAFSTTASFYVGSGAQVMLQDLFRPGSPFLSTLSDAAISQIAAQQGTGGFGLGLGSLTLDQFAAWDLTADSVEVTFGQGTVAAEVAGPIRVRFPYDSLRPVIAVPGPLDHP